MFKHIALIVLLPQLLVFGTLDRIQKAMEKKEYEKALELIQKGYEKEPKNPGISYYHAKLFFDQAYSRNNIDTARLAIERAHSFFNQASQDLKEEVVNEGITLEKITQLHNQIRDRSFQNTLKNLSINSALDFQKKFPESVYDDILNFKVDSMEFRMARLANTEVELIRFVKEHPTSVFTPKADSILDDMRFEVLLRNGGLKSYYAFHSKYPLSRHKYKVENYILKVSTASHSITAYENFIAFASMPALKKRAADVHYYLSGYKDYIFHPERDSLQRSLALSQTELFPAIQNGKYGFFDRQGRLRIGHNYVEISMDYTCRLTMDDWVFVKDSSQGFILTKGGNIVLNKIDDYKSVNNAIGLAKKDDLWFLYHKSGFKILDYAIQDAEVIANKWIKVKRSDKWGLVSLLGLQIAEPLYDDIFKTQSFWVFRKSDLIAVYTEPLILKEIEERGLSLEFKFDDIELVNSNALIGFRGERECLLDSTLNFLIPWGTYEIYPETSGWYLRSDQGYRLYNESEADVMDRHYAYLESNEGWLALKTETDWMLLPRRQGLLPSRSYDSVKLVNSYAAILIKEDKRELLFSSGTSIPLSEEKIRTFQNSPGFVSLFDGLTTTIFDPNGQQVVTGKFDNTTFLNDSLIRVQVRNKQGLIHTDGHWILNPVFDSIDEKNGLVLTLINGKIGCYDPEINELIATEYEARVERIGKYYLAKKDGKYGVIDQVKAEVIPFNYEEIRLWNDTSYLVRQAGEFLVINSSQENVYNPVESVTQVVQNNRHDIFRYIRDGRYGLMSNKFGELLGSEFTDIFNIGTEAEPLFFADQHLDKAGFHVVSYVNQFGKLIMSKAYTLEEFDKILCDD